MKTVLVCDDEKDIVSALRIYLEAEGYGVVEANNGDEAIAAVKKTTVHCILLDVMMPVMDGLTAMVKIRDITNAPIILLTAKSEDTDKVMGLNIGADDYITKPFNPVEVLARVKSHLRRYTQLGGSSEKKDVLTVDGLILNDKTKQVYVDEEEIRLTPTEFDILRLFMTHPNQVYSPQEIYRIVWEDNPIGNETTVAVHIRHLREKIEINPADPRYLKVVWGQGYKLESEGHK